MIEGILREIRKSRFLSSFIDPCCILLSILSSLFLIDRISYESDLSRYTISTFHFIIPSVAVSVLAMYLITSSRRRVKAKELEMEIVRIDINSRAEGRLATFYELKDRQSTFKEALEKDAERNLSGLNIVGMFAQKERRFVRLAGIVAVVALATLLIAPSRAYEEPTCDFVCHPVKGTAPLSVRFYDTSTGYIDGFDWSIEAKTYSGPGVQHTFANPGTYSITLGVSGPGGKRTLTKQDMVTVLPHDHPYSDFELYPVSGKCPLTVNFRNNSKNSDRFEWDFGDGTVSNEDNPQHTFTKRGIFSISLVAGRGGRHDKTTKKDAVLVVDDDGVLSDFAAHPVEGNAPLTVQFEDRSKGPIIAYSWELGTGTASKDKNPSFTYTVPGFYTVSLTVYGPNHKSTQTKKHYIRVHDKKGGGGPSIAEVLRSILNPTHRGRRGTEEGRLYGEKTERPKIEKVPIDVKPIEKEGPLITKDRKIYTKTGKDSEYPKEIPYKDAYFLYSRIKEDAINSERIPLKLREMVREYFELIRPQ